jgi:hypothetical protein
LQLSLSGIAQDGNGAGVLRFIEDENMTLFLFRLTFVFAAVVLALDTVNWLCIG